MATISITTGGDVECEPIKPSNESTCLSFSVTAYLDILGRKEVYMRDRIYLHGTIEEIREFLEKGLAALPPVVKPQLTIEDIERQQDDIRIIHEEAREWMATMNAVEPAPIVWPPEEHE